MTMTVGLATKKIWFNAAASTIDSPTAHSLTISAGGSVATTQETVEMDGAIGSTKSLSTLTIANATSVGIANVGNSAGPAPGLTGALSVSTGSAGIAFAGNYYQTVGAQTWYTGGSLATPAPQSLSISSSATTWTTPVKLNLYGNLVSAGGAATLISNDIGLNPAGTSATLAYGHWTLGANQLNFYTQSPATPMMIGIPATTADAVGQWHLDQAELLSLNTASLASKVVFGQPGIQTGSIAFQAANLSTASTSLEAYTNGSSGGNISLNDGGTSYGLNNGSATVTLTAGGSILSAQTQNAFPEISTTGTVNLDAIAGMIGGTGTGSANAGPPLQVQYFASTTVNIHKNPGPGTTAPLGVWIEGIGGH